MIALSGIKKSFGQHTVLNGVDINIDTGKVVVLVGSSGSGKTTLLRCINFLELADEGQISLEGFNVDVKHAKRSDINYIRQHTAMVFQQYNLFKNKTVLKNVTEALLVVKKLSRAEANETAEHFLQSVNMWEKRNEYPSRISGGQAQRVAIARALALNPKVILFDEPTSALDPELVGEVLDVMKQVAVSGITMVVVTHEMQFAFDVAEKVVFLDEGIVLEENLPKEIFLNPQNERTRQFFARTSWRNDNLQ